MYFPSMSEQATRTPLPLGHLVRRASQTYDTLQRIFCWVPCVGFSTKPVPGTWAPLLRSNGTCYRQGQEGREQGTGWFTEPPAPSFDGNSEGSDVGEGEGEGQDGQGFDGVGSFEEGR